MAARDHLFWAEDKAGTKTPVIGEGEHRYECHHEWCVLSPEFPWQTTHGVCVDQAGHVYIKQQGHGKLALDTIFVFDKDGKFIRSFGKSIYPGGHGIDLRKEGSQEFLYLCDIAHGQVLKTSLLGEVVWKMGFPPEANVYQNPQDPKKPKPYRPTNLAFVPDGGIYVADGYGQKFYPPVRQGRQVGPDLGRIWN